MFYTHKSITAESHLIFGCLLFGMSLDFEVLYFFLKTLLNLELNYHLHSFTGFC